MKYVVLTNPDVKFMIGAIMQVEDTDADFYTVIEGYYDAIKKDAVTEITEDEYKFIKKVHSELRQLIPNMSDVAAEFVNELTLNKKEW